MERLTEAAFEPYGQVLAAPAREPVWTREGLVSWRMGFSIDGAMDLKITRFLHHERSEFELLERHLTYTESRVPLAGGQAIYVVAASVDLGDAAERPDPDSVRAFHLDGTCGVMVWKGTWHALDSFPLTPPHTDFVILTERETQVEIESSAEPLTTGRTHVADYRPSGIRFRIVDRDGVLAAGG